MRTPGPGWLAALACALFPAAHCAAAAPTGEEVARQAGAYMQARAAAGHFSGVVAVARGGRPLFIHGYGFADESKQLLNAPATRFPIASITKTFTAMLVMQLQQRRMLAIDDALCTHLSPCPASWRAITLRHLLMHTAGIADYAGDPDFADKRRRPRAREQIIAEFRDRPIEFAPGAQYRYSNSGYLVLAAVLEKVSGKSYERLLRELILTPLDMRNTGVESAASPALARGYRPDGVHNVAADPVDPSWLDGAGAIYSTVDDLLRWDRALRSDVLLPRDVLATMWSPTLGSYGIGWQIQPPSEQSLHRMLVFHSGGTTGFATDLLRFTDEQVTVIILANLMPVPLAQMSRDLGAIAFGESHELPVVRRAVEVDPSLYDAYAGRYGLAPGIEIVVTRADDRLIVQASGQPADVAIPESPTTFFSRVSPVRITFVMGADRRATKLVLHEPGRDRIAPRL